MLKYLGNLERHALSCLCGISSLLRLSSLDQAEFNGLLVTTCTFRLTNHTDTPPHTHALLQCTLCWRACTCPLFSYSLHPHILTHTHTPQPPQHIMLSEKRSSEPETIASLSAAAQNKQRVACWSSLLLGVSLRAGARASVGGVSWGFSDDGMAINIQHQCTGLLLSSVWSTQTSCTLSEWSNQPNAQSAEAHLSSIHTQLYSLVLPVA